MDRRRASAVVLAIASTLPLALVSVAGAGVTDRQIANNSVLTADDVPTGFVQEPAGADDPPSRGPRCKQITKAAKELNRVPNREVSFAQGRQALINNQVSVFETPKAAKAVFAAYSGKRAPGCFEEGFEEAYAKQLGPGSDVEVTLDRYQPDLGDEAAGYEMEIGIASADGDTAVLYVNLEIARVGRAINAFGFIRENELFASDEIVAMTDAGMERLEQNL